MNQVKILKLAIVEENQKTSQKWQSYDLLVEKTQKMPLSVDRKGLENVDRTSIGLEKSRSITGN